MDTFEIEHLNEFTEHGRIQGYSEKTVEIYERAVRDFFQWLIIHKVSTLKNIVPKHLRTYQNELNNKYSINTVVIKIRTVKQFFAFLVDRNFILINPANDLVLPVTDKTLPVNVLTENEMKKLLNAPNSKTPVGIRNRTILELLYSTAIRRAECLALMIQDVDLDEGIVRINQGKGAKDRLVPLGDTAVEWVRRYIKEVRAVKINSDNDNGYLFITLCNGKPLSQVSLNRTINKYGHGILKKPVSVHTIRRSCATHLIRAGASPKFVQEILGHSCPDTMQRYVRLVANDVRQAHHEFHPRERSLDND